MNKDLGFGALSSIKPDAPARSETPAVSDRKVDEIAERHGFVSREPTEKIVRKRQAEPSANLNIRPPVSVFNRFVKFAMDNRYSYPDALAALMDKAGVE